MKLLKRTGGIVVGLLLTIPSSTSAFDTGHHWEITWNALAREGFSEDAIRVVVLQNWLTDYYGGQDDWFVRTLRLSDEKDKLTIKNATFLHFDNMRSTAAATRYWQVLVDSTASQLHAKLQARDDDPMAILTLLGLSLHAVQDFYSHSTWVERVYASRPDGCAPPHGTYSSRTWFDARPGEFTVETGAYPDSNGPRGGRHKDLNKDSVLAEVLGRSLGVGLPCDQTMGVRSPSSSLPIAIRNFGAAASGSPSCEAATQTRLRTVSERPMYCPTRYRIGTEAASTQSIALPLAEVSFRHFRSLIRVSSGRSSNDRS